MTKILIVDDELFVRVGIKSSINWAKYSFEVVGEVSNGEEALAILRHEPVDIVLLDIEMPVMNGIEVLKIIKEEEIDVKVIILSCHEDFKFAQQALRLGAVDYILKLSVNSQKLLELLIGIQKSIKVTFNESKTMNLQKEWQRIAITKNEFDLSILQKKGSRLLSCEGYLIIFNVDNYVKKRKSNSASDNRIFSQSTMNLTSEIINDYVTCDVFWLDDIHYIAVINPEKTFEDNMDKILEELQKALHRYMQITVSITVCTDVINLQNFRKAIDLLKRLNEKRFVEGPGSIRYCDKKRIENIAISHKILFDTTMERELERAIEYGDQKRAIEVLMRYFELVSKTDMAFVRAKFNRDMEEILHLYSKELKLYNQQFNDIIGYDMLVERSELSCFEYIYEVIDWFQAFNKLYFKHLQIMREETMEKDIKQCLDYIKINFREEITVSMLAELFNMSASYFGTLFKKKVGVNLNQYLTDYRMEMSKILLRTTDKSITEISDEIGYENIYYFSNVFKKKFNMSPNVYRKSLIKK